MPLLQAKSSDQATGEEKKRQMAHRVYGISAAAHGGCDDVRDAQVRLCAGRLADAHRFVRKLRTPRVYQSGKMEQAPSVRHQLPNFHNALQDQVARRTAVRIVLEQRLARLMFAEMRICAIERRKRLYQRAEWHATLCRWLLSRVAARK